MGGADPGQLANTLVAMRDYAEAETLLADGLAAERAGRSPAN
ncbi:MAG: hypothetical protein U0703_11470 [Anaerolineae bacterium]